MGVTTTQTNKPLNPRGNDQSPLAFNRAKLYSGKALDFDGVNDILTMPTALTSSLSTTTITHVVNFKTDFTTWSGARYEVFSYNERGVFLSFNNGNIYVYYRHNASGWGNFQIPVGDVKMQEWNHCVIVIDYGNTLGKAYINGQEVVSSVLSQTGLAYDANALTIGGQSTYRFFDGQIAGFKLFNTALTAAQVADLYNNPEKVVPTGVDNTALKLWLPMQEGAGTTAYDGSGNGNHGAVSGASWLHGIGAPVGQTAVISWNKAKNYVKRSEDFDNSDWSKLISGNGTLNRTSNYAEAPDGSQNATRVQATYDPTQPTSYGLLTTNASTSTTGNYISGIWVKSNTGSNQNITMYVRNGIDGEDIVATSEWQRVTKRGSVSNNYVVIGTRNDLSSADESIDILVWGASINYGTEVDSYVPTYGSGQESEVLLPQGLTTGRDITGVNLFENVRKQGALNLDGNSWAEVHDNESLDITSAISLECWFDNTNAYDSIRYLFDKSAGSTSGFELRLVSQNSVQTLFRNLTTISNVATIPTSGWVHVVGIYDGSDIIVYVNGTLAGSVASSGSIGTNDDVLSIGGDNSYAPYRLNKPIAQPRIYNRALTAEEVQRNYNAGKNIYTNS